MATIALTNLKSWLKQHAKGEKQLARVLNRYFREQRSRVLAAARDYTSLTTAVVPHIFNAADEHQKLMKAISTPMLSFMAQGAANALAARPKKTKAFSLEDWELPDDVRDAILAAFNVLEGEQYWQDIQATTSDRITAVILESIELGHNHSQMVRLLETTLAGMGRLRAQMIARTETTLGYNAGHQASYDALAADGDISGKMWLAVVDDDTRPAHLELDGVTVGPQENFEVGGHSAPYPGHPSLPAEQRVRCRCVTVAAFSEG